MGERARRKIKAERTLESGLYSLPRTDGSKAKLTKMWNASFNFSLVTMIQKHSFPLLQVKRACPIPSALCCRFGHLSQSMGLSHLQLNLELPSAVALKEPEAQLAKRF